MFSDPIPTQNLQLVLDSFKYNYTDPSNYLTKRNRDGFEELPQPKVNLFFLLQT